MATDMNNFRFWCQKVLPAIYDDSLSYYEVLCKLTKFMENSMQDVEGVEEALKELKEYVDNYFDSLDVQTAIDNTIEELIDNGEIGDLIKVEIDKTYYQKNSTIVRVGRFLDRFGYDETTRVLYGQACCYYNNQYYVCGSYNSNANQTITVWNANGVLLNSKVYTDLGHANDICYLDGNLYVATQNGVTIVDAETLEIIDSFTIQSLSTVRCISTDGQYVYASGVVSSPLFGIVKYNPSDETIENLVLNLTFGAGRPQGMEYYDGYFYFLYNEANSVVKISETDFEKVFIYNIPDNDGYFYTGELEDLLIVNGRLYLFSYATLNESKADAVFAQLFDSDIIGKLESSNFFSYMSYQTPAQITLNGTATTVFNPTSTFNTAEELGVIVPSIGIVASNINGGCYSNRRGKNVSIYSGNGITLNYIDMRSGSIMLHNVIVNEMYSLGAKVYAHNGSITFGGFRFSVLDALNCSVIFTTTTERSEINFETTHGGQSADFTNATSLANTVVHIKGAYCSLSNFKNNIYQTIVSGNNGFASVYRVNISCVFNDTTNNISFIGNIGAVISSWVSGFSMKTNEGYTITISNTGDLTAVDKDGVAAVISSINNFSCTISNN